MAQERPPTILQIFREPLRPGSEEAYASIEEETARHCAELNCPHPYLGMESLTGSREVWWLNGFESEAEKQRVYDDYANNRALMAALERNSKRKESLTGTPDDVLANYRADLSRGAAWNLAGARFVVVTMTKQDPAMAGVVFEAPDGTRFIMQSVRAQDQADALAAAAGPETWIFAVRPSWGMPASEWIAGDPESWESNPMASIG